jgi:cellulose synthase/poly-beta-1,6-N-acetylglucosamine synthase-like glycosyltransferase
MLFRILGLTMLLQNFFILSIRIVVFLLPVFLKLNAEENVSVIVPCHHAHVGYLPELIRAHSEQSIPPFEIVISLSGTSKIPLQILEDLIRKNWNISVRWVLHREELSRGRNRNMALKAARGAIIIPVDADDLPHPQRVELILKAFWAHPEADVIIHGLAGPCFSNRWISDRVRLSTLEWHSLLFPLECCEVYDYIPDENPDASLPEKSWLLALGAPAFRRAILKNYNPWPEKMTAGEDNACLLRWKEQGCCFKYINFPLYYYELDRTIGGY